MSSQMKILACALGVWMFFLLPLWAASPLNEDELLDLIEKRAFFFFWNEVNPDNGLIADAAPEIGSDPDLPCSVASIAFGLTGICIAESRHWITREEAVARIIKTLSYMYNDLETKEGFYYHFMGMKDGKRRWNCELSSMDTALLLAGAITCREYFEDDEIIRLVNDIYARVNWPWMLNGKDTLSMGWRPEHGFIKHHWDTYSEHMVMYLLAIGSPFHPLPVDCWHAWKRPAYSYNGMTYLQSVPLFLHQYSHGWVDFRDKRDAYADYFVNTRLATRAHRDYCVALHDTFPHYQEDLWGITASEGPRHYMVWGGPPPTMEYPIDGTIVPCAAGGSVAFDPESTVPVLQNIYNNYNSLGWGKYGLVDAFNPQTGWVADKYLGIDLGATMIGIENLRTGNVWKWFMESPEIQQAMVNCGFHATFSSLDSVDRDYLHGVARDTWACIQEYVCADSMLPYETSEKPPEVSLRTIGLFLADLVAASAMDLLPAAEARMQAQKIVSLLKAQPAWNGFLGSRIQVETGEVVEGVYISTTENGIWAAGLIAVAEAFPVLRPACNELLDAMEWGALYDADKSLLYSGVDLTTGVPIKRGHIDLLGSEGRLAVVMAIASGHVSVQAWDHLNRELMQSSKVRYLKPGTMPYLPGVFLDESDTFMGRSAANYAFADMEQARQSSQTVWGISSVGGDTIVAPCASVLAINAFPGEVVANLRALEAKGVRAPLKAGDQKQAFGFQDRFNRVSGAVSGRYRMADQSILLLSLANFLYDDVILNGIVSCGKIKQTLAHIPDYAQPEGGAHVSICRPGISGNVPVPQVIRTLDIPFMTTPPVYDGDFSDWVVAGAVGQDTIQFPAHAESGAPPEGYGLQASFSLAWDTDYLYVGITVQEDELVAEQSARMLYKDDAIELFIDPECDGFRWGNRKDYQIGFSILPDHKEVQSYAWFQNRIPPGVIAAAHVDKVDDGACYTIEAAVPWAFLNMKHPQAGDEFCGTIAVHSVDAARETTAKINWSYVTEVDKGQLGRLRLVGGPLLGE